MTIGGLDWDDLRLFLAIARAGTLTAAASNLRLSQPTAGRRLRSLEEACGFALFQRTSTGFRLTDEGDTMLLHAERMEEEMLALERQFAGNDGSLQGQLRLSSSDWFGRIVLTPRIAAFVALHPLVTVELVTDFACSISIGVRPTSFSVFSHSMGRTSFSGAAPISVTACSPPGPISIPMTPMVRITGW